MKTDMQRRLEQNSIDAERVIKMADDNGVTSIRIVFVDQHGVTRGKTILISGLRSAFKSGIQMTSTLLLKDTAHNTVFPVWSADAGFGEGVMTGASDFITLPDPSTFKVLPWLNNTAWMISDIFQTDGSNIELSTRFILRRSLAELKQHSLQFVCGLEVEFYVFKMNDKQLANENANCSKDPPPTSLIAQGYQYLTENRIDQLDDVLQLLHQNCEALDLPLRTMESEFGPSQFEFTFEPLPGLEAADLMILFRNMVKQVCRRHGYHATFMCRPKFEKSMASGWHLHQSLSSTETGLNRFIPEEGERVSSLAKQWMAGILKHASESCLFTTPTVNGYKRYQPFALAPDRIQWGVDNRGAMLRSLANHKDSTSRIENRVGEPAANPYLYLASQVLSGLEGIDNNLEPPDAVEAPYDTDAQPLPDNMSSALSAFKQSKFYREKLGSEFVDYFCQIKQAEWDRYLSTVSEWEQREYFSLF